jgi:hypothetical protein
MVILLLLDRAGPVGGECCGYSEVSMWQPSSVLVKDCTILALMACLELYTDHMSGFMRPDKLSSFCKYYVVLHLLLRVVLLLFGGRMRPRAKISSQE